MIGRFLSFISALIMGFTIVDAFAYLITSRSLAQNMFGGGSPLTNALLDLVPGMSPWEFFAANAVVLLCIGALLFISVYGMMSGGNYGDVVCECKPAPKKDCPFKEGSLMDTVDKASKEFEDYVDRKEHELGHRMSIFRPYGKGGRP